jgi:hypothetical protein
VKGNLGLLFMRVLEPLRVMVECHVHIISGYRCPELNDHVGGSRSSQHMTGQAADFIVDDFSVNEVCQLIADHFPFDQVISEFGEWTHVSYCADRHRGEKWLYTRVDGQVVKKQVDRFV